MARTCLGGIGTAVLTSAQTSISIPVLHAETQDGRTILVADAESLSLVGVHLPDVGMPFSDIPALLQIRSMAPVEDITVTRAITLISGTVGSLPPAFMAGAMQAEYAGVRLGEVVGHRAGSRLLRFSPEECDVLIGEEYTEVPIAEVRRAAPDPLAHEEGRLVMDLLDETAGSWEEFLQIKGTARGADGESSVPLSEIAQARPIGIDRYGITLICHWYDRNPATLRVPFPAPVADGQEALQAARFLLMAHRIANPL